MGNSKRREKQEVTGSSRMTAGELEQSIWSHLKPEQRPWLCASTATRVAHVDAWNSQRQRSSKRETNTLPGIHTWTSKRDYFSIEIFNFQMYSYLKLASLKKCWRFRIFPHLPAQLPGLQEKAPLSICLLLSITHCPREWAGSSGAKRTPPPLTISLTGCLPIITKNTNRGLPFHFH